VLKTAAASAELLAHRGPALVFDAIEDYLAVCDSLDLPVSPETVLVVRGSGPVGYPGFPEVGNPPLPRKLLRDGVRDMVRISDGRMSGTGFGTCVLHVCPEARAGGPLALVRTGDIIELDVPRGRLDLCVPDSELNQRDPALPASPVSAPGGWAGLYRAHVLQADQGADLDFLTGIRGCAVPRHVH
jgi:L-arabonate dehydrase